MKWIASYLVVALALLAVPRRVPWLVDWQYNDAYGWPARWLIWESGAVYGRHPLRHRLGLSWSFEWFDHGVLHPGSQFFFRHSDGAHLTVYTTTLLSNIGVACAGVTGAAAPGAWRHLRRQRRIRRGCCRGCGYNLTGNVSGICPECGLPVHAGDATNTRASGAQPATGSQTRQRRRGWSLFVWIVPASFAIAWFVTAPPQFFIDATRLECYAGQEQVLRLLGPPDRWEALEDPHSLPRFLWYTVFPPAPPLPVERWTYVRPRYFWETDPPPVCWVTFDSAQRVHNYNYVRTGTHNPRVFWIAMLVCVVTLGLGTYGARSLYARVKPR